MWSLLGPVLLFLFSFFFFFKFYNSGVCVVNVRLLRLQGLLVTEKSLKQPIWRILLCILNTSMHTGNHKLLCIGGDFNVVPFWGERRKCPRNWVARHISDFIEELHLRDLPQAGSPFTWSGGLNTLSWSSWIASWYPKSGRIISVGIQCALPRLVFDHTPILLDGERMKRGKIAL